MTIKKISSRNRIKVSYKIVEELGFNYWEPHRARGVLQEGYGLRFTSRRCGVLYFQVVDQKKYMLFVIRFGNFIK
jgi:hypothetical protein